MSQLQLEKTNPRHVFSALTLCKSYNNYSKETGKRNRTEGCDCI